MRLIVNNLNDVEPHSEDDSLVWVLAKVIEDGVEIDAHPGELREEIKAALEGDSNDAEHDALASVAAYFDIEWSDPDDVLNDDDGS